MTITIVTSADQHFVRPLAALLQSTVDVHHNIPLDIYVIGGSIKAEDRKRISNICEVAWLTPAPTTGVHIELPAYLSVASLWRLNLADLLPNSLDRVIYLDADTLVRKSLQDLWDTELGPTCVAAVRDPVIPWFGSATGPPWEELGISPDVSYFNAGVLLIDVASWRRDRIGDIALDALRKNRFPYADQCALNAALASQWTRLPPRWNLQAAHLIRSGSTATVELHRDLLAACRDPSVVHFNSSRLGRPWVSECSHPFAAEWHAALARTDWFGWRPPRRSLKTRARRLHGRVSKAWSVFSSSS